MNGGSLKKYISIGFLYVLLTALLLAYRYVRHDQFSLELYYSSIGVVGIVTIGLFLLSGALRRTFPQLNSWQETIGLLGTVGIASSLLTIRSPQVIVVFAILLVFLVFYSKHLLQTSPPGLAQRLKNLLGVMILLVLLFVTIIDRFTSLKDWFAFIFNLDNSIRVTFLPPISVLIVLYIIIVLSIYLWWFFTEPPEAESSKTQPPSIPAIPTPLIRPSPTAPAPSKPQGPPLTTALPQNSPSNMELKPSNMTGNQSAQAQ